MSRGFTSTSVLESTDGIEFSVEKRKDTEETRLARLRAAQAEAKPLFEQLAEQKQKKQEEYDAVTKLIFAPPKALDEEDVEFYEELSKRKAEMDAKLSTEEEQMLAAYRAARSSASVTEAPTVALLNPKPKPQQKKGNGSASKPAATIVIKPKRKEKASSNSSAADASGAIDDASAAKKPKTESTTTAPATAAATEQAKLMTPAEQSASNPLAVLSAYAESSDEEDS